MHPGCTGEPGKAPGLVFEHKIGGDDRAVALGPELDFDDAARGRSGRPEHLLAGHHNLDRPSRFLRQRQCDGFEIDQRLAAEPAADLGRHDSDTGNVDAEQLGAIGADHELALARRPDLHLPVGGGRDDAGMGFDMGLVHRLCRIAPGNDDIGLAEAGLGRPFKNVTRLAMLDGRAGLGSRPCV
jgi:hypothetical protein